MCGKLVGKYTVRPMDAMGNNPKLSLGSFNKQWLLTAEWKCRKHLTVSKPLQIGHPKKKFIFIDFFQGKGYSCFRKGLC